MAYEAQKSRAPDQGQDIDGLLQALKAEEQWASSYQKSELETAQIEALQRYFGDEYGDEVEGRSRVTTREVYEIIQWLRPDLRRTFTAGEKVFEYEGVTPEADQHAEAATDLINHIFLCDNEGERHLDAWIFDGLLQRVGVIAAEWKQAEHSPAQEVSGLNSMQAQQVINDPRLYVKEQEVEEGPPDEAHPDGLYYAFKICRRVKDAYPEVFTIAPEDFRISARSVDLETARYCGDRVRMMRGEAKLKWPEYAEEIDAHTGDTSGWNADERRAERFRDVEGWDDATMRREGEGDAGEVEIWREYIRYDLDGDGFPELIRCYRLGDCLLEHEEVDEHIYAHWTPNPIPHRFFGLSIADEAKDIQRTKTVLMRGFLDAINLTVNPRVAFDATKVLGRGLDALLTVRPGVAIDVQGNPVDAIVPQVIPDVSQPALTGMQWIDRVAESRTGVNRSAQPMDPDLLHDTARGVELLQNAASVRKEEIARNLAMGLQQFGMKLYRLVHKHQNEARSIKIAGQWRNIDPSAWDAQMRCSVSVGLGTGAREKQLLMWQMMQADQAAWVANYGPGQPYGPRPHNLYALAQEKYKIIGIKNAGRFLGQEPPPEWAPEPPPNPEAAKLQAEMQKEQMKIQAQKEQTALQAEKDMQVAARQQHDEMVRAENDRQSAMLEHEREVARLNLEAEQIAFEREKAEREHQIKLMELQLKAQEIQVKAAAIEVAGDGQVTTRG